MTRAPSVAKRVLVIEDEESVARFLGQSLATHHYDVRLEATGSRGIQAAIEFRPELIILDLGLPDLDGHSVLLKLREWVRAPIIILTARESDEDKVRALDCGADDYLTKPFSIVELLARMRVAFRHFETVGRTQETIYKNGPLVCDLSSHVIKVDGNMIHLTSTEYEILKCLIRNSGKVVTHRTLLKEVWGPHSVEHTQYLRVYVGQLRKKLKSSSSEADLILTEPGVGYRLAES